jgi:hypothetical protein
MESKSISLIEEEIFYYSNTSNFRVGSIKASPQKPNCEASRLR